MTGRHRARVRVGVVIAEQLTSAGAILAAGYPLPRPRPERLPGRHHEDTHQAAYGLAG